jgi:hypothetical protein
LSLIDSFHTPRPASSPHRSSNRSRCSDLSYSTSFQRASIRHFRRFYPAFAFLVSTRCPGSTQYSHARLQAMA